MKVKILNLDYNDEIREEFIIGKVYEAADNNFGHINVKGEDGTLWSIEKNKGQFKVIKQRKVYLKTEKDFIGHMSHNCSCNYCHLDKYNKQGLTYGCAKIMERYSLPDCRENNIHFKLIKIEESK